MRHNWFRMYVFGHKKVTCHTGSIQAAHVAEQTRPVTAPSVLSARATFVLQRNDLLSIRVRRRPYRIACIAGRLWTTVDNSFADTLLVAGETVTYHKSGKIVIQALRTATVRIECPSPARIVVDSPVRPVFQPG
jgi:hypothetical protein